MRVGIKADCGHHEEKKHVEDGKCRNCRGVDKPEPIGNYIPQRERLQNREALDHAENESRSHVINNDR